MVGALNKRDGNKTKKPFKVRKRFKIDLEMKLKLISRYESGLGLSAVAREFGFSVSTVNSIVKDSDRIKQHVNKSPALLKSTIITKKRAGAIDGMEKLLTEWIDVKMKGRNPPLKLTAVQAKARYLYDKLKEEQCSDLSQTFIASTGWFNRFKIRAGLNVRIVGGSLTTTTITNNLAATGGESVKTALPTNLNVTMKSEPSAPDYSDKSKTTTRPTPTSETLSSPNSLIQHDPLSQPSSAKIQKKTERRFGDQFFEDRRQMAFTEPALMSAPSRTDMQVQQRLQVAAPSRTERQVQQRLQVSAQPPAQSQPVQRQVQVLAPPVQVAVAKPKPVEKPRPREKRIFVVADHQRCVMSNLASLWKSGKLCDAGIGNGSSTIKVHKVVLSAVCPKLLSVFSTDTLSQKFLQVNFPEEVSTEALNAFAEYMYNGILDLDRDILEQLKIIAKRLDMKEFEQLCDSHLPNHMRQTTSAAAAASFTNLPLIQSTMSIPAMPSFGTTVSTPVQSAAAPSITTQVIDIKQEITDAELAQIQKDTAAVFGQESQVISLAPNNSGVSAGFVISPSVKTERVDPEDDKYGHLTISSSNNNPVYTSTTSSSSIAAAASTQSTTSIPVSSTEYAIPFTDTTDVKSTRLKVPPHSYGAPPLVSDLSPISNIVETVCSQSNQMNVDSSKPLSWLSNFTSSVEGPSTSTDNGVYPVGMFASGGDNLPLFTTQNDDDVKTIDFYSIDLT